MDKLDMLLQKKPITIPIRENLTQDTLVAIKQIKRIRLARRMLLGLLAIMSILLIVKWLNNDVFYLLQLLLTKFTFIKIQSGLYIAAFTESLPREQFFLILIVLIVWYSWRRFETFLLHSRITTRQTFTMKMIRLTPKLFVINILVILLGIGFATYSYAQKTGQKQLQLLKEHVNASGRIAFETNLPASQCNLSSDTNLITNQFEIKKDAQLSLGDAKKVLEAACNQTEANKFLITTFHLGNPDQGIDGIEESPTSDIELFITSQVIKKENNTLSLQDAAQSDHAYTFSFTPQTKVFENNVQMSQNTLQKNDIVVSLVRNRYSSTVYGHPSGDVSSRTLLGVYILPSDPEFKWYGLNFQHMITQIKMCPGNPQDHCTFTGGVDFFPITERESDSTVNPEFTQAPQGIQKEIAGKLIDIQATFVKIKTSSGRIFTIQFGQNVIDEFNQKQAPYYKATFGDTLLITYFEPADHHATILTTNQIINAELMLEVNNKKDPAKKY